PEQYRVGPAFAVDLYALGSPMYHMLTGARPYEAPAPADMDRLMRGELVTAPRLRNPKLPKAINDIVLKAMAPQIHDRYQRASDLLDDVIAARAFGPRRTPKPAASEPAAVLVDVAQEVQSRLKARDAPQRRFGWH